MTWSIRGGAKRAPCSSRGAPSPATPSELQQPLRDSSRQKTATQQLCSVADRVPKVTPAPHPEPPGLVLFCSLVPPHCRARSMASRHLHVLDNAACAQ